MSGETQSSAAGGPAPAGWGAAPSFLPPAVALRAAQADAKEAVEARQAEDEAEARREELRQRHLGLYAEQAAARGELVSAVALATGRIPGRTVAEILDAGRAAGDRDDVIAEARLHREGHGDPAPVHVEFVDDPRLHPVRSETGRRIFHRARRFQRLLEARKALAEAQEAERRTRDHFPLERPVTLRSRSQPEPEPEPERAPEPGFGPANVPWSQVSGWLAQGWRP